MEATEVPQPQLVPPLQSLNSSRVSEGKYDTICGLCPRVCGPANSYPTCFALFLYLKGNGHTHRFPHPLVHSADAHTCWGLSQAKPGARNLL